MIAPDFDSTFSGSSSDIWQRRSVWLYGLAFLVFIFLYALLPIQDPDFWWHLKTGEVMAHNGGLLESDPFNFTGDGVVSNREAIILKGYWLWQITAYGLYSLFGFQGIFLLNLLTLLAMSGVMVQQMRRCRVDSALAIPLLTCAFYLFSSTFSLERPQVISFLFAAILLALLERARAGGVPGWPLPLLMLFWANLHGGFVVGDIILLCFAAGAIVEHRRDLPRLRRLLLWAGIGIGASFLNPNGPMVFVELLDFHNSDLMIAVSEYQSTWANFQQGSRSVAILWLLIALYGFGLWSSRRLYWPELIVALFLAYFSSSYMRNIAFFAMAMLPATGFHLQRGAEQHGWRLSRAVKFSLVIISALVLVWQGSEFWQRERSSGGISSFYPVGLADFILSSGIQGRMFNDYDFSGYLLWRLYPQQRLFIDGRGLDAEVYRDGKKISAASMQEVAGRKEFEVLLDRYAIDFVALPHRHLQSGRLTTLMKFLSIKPEWIPVYVDAQSYILVRSSPANAAMIARYRLEKNDFYAKVLASLTADCNRSPKNVGSHVALAELLIFLGLYDQAEERLSVIFALQPGNPELPILRNQLEVLRRQSRSSGY